MIFFDYVYYFFCNLYRLSKREKHFYSVSKRGEHLSGWKISGTVAGGGSIVFFCMPLLIIADKISGYTCLNVFSILFLFIVFYTFFIIRYTRYTDYLTVEGKLKSLSKISVLILNICLVLYLLIIVGGFIYMIYIGWTKSAYRR
jgi:hypothetical protein